QSNVARTRLDIGAELQRFAPDQLTAWHGGARPPVSIAGAFTAGLSQSGEIQFGAFEHEAPGRQVTAPQACTDRKIATDIELADGQSRAACLHADAALRHFAGGVQCEIAG